MLPNIKKIKEEKSDEIKDDAINIINKLNNLKDSIDNYYNIYEDIINNNYGNKKRNFYLIQNINDMIIYNKKIIEDLNRIIKEKNIINKFNYMIDIYNKFNLPNNKNIDSSEVDNEIINRKEINKVEDKKEEDKIIKNNNSNDGFLKENKIELVDKDLWNSSEKREENYFVHFNASKIKKILMLKSDIFEVNNITI